MDPNAALARMLHAANEINKIWDAGNEDGTLTVEQQSVMADIAAVAADAILALNGWMVKGGFAPSRWDSHTDQSER